MKLRLILMVMFCMVPIVGKAGLFSFFSRKAETKKDKFEMIDKANNYDTINQNLLSGLQELNKDQSMPRNKWARATDQELSSKFGVYTYNKDINNYGIRSWEKYLPANYSADKKPVVVILIHGTWAAGAEDYFDANKDFYKYSREFASIQAERKNASVEVVSFRWPGSNSSSARQNGSVVLASILNNYFRGYEIITIAHSHGCNLVNSASRILPEDMIVDHIINIATPVRDESEEKFKPLRFAKLTQFYSNSDLVAALGSVTPFNIFSNGNSRKYSNQAGRYINNIRTQIDAKDMGHSNIKAVILWLDEILNKIESNYIYNSNLNLNLSTTANNQDAILVSIRDEINANSDAILSNVNDPLIINQIAYEKQFSDNQKKTFESIYNRSMDTKANIFKRLWNGIRQEVYNNFG